MYPPYTVTILCLKGESFPKTLSYAGKECIAKCRKCKTATHMVYLLFGDNALMCQVEDNNRKNRNHIEWFLN